MGRKPSPATRERWRLLIEAFESSPLTAVDFCQQHDVSTASLYLWRRRFRESTADAASQLALTISPEPTQAATLIPVHLNASSSSPQSNQGDQTLAVLRFSDSLSMDLLDTETVCEIVVRLAGLDSGDRP